MMCKKIDNIWITEQFLIITKKKTLKQLYYFAKNRLQKKLTITKSVGKFVCTPF